MKACRQGDTHQRTARRRSPGLYYTAFTAVRLTDPFVASAASVKMTAEKASGISFSLPTDGNSSLFVRIIASDMPYQADTPLPAEASKR